MAILLVTMVFTNWLLSKEVKRLNNPDTKVPETIYSSKPYIQPQPYKSINIPEVVWVYKVDTIKPLKIDSVVGINLDKTQVSIALLKDSTVYKDMYKLDLDNYKYIFVNGTLTSKKIPFIQKLKPSVELEARPINQMYDLTLGLLFETKSLNYKLGFNTYYYPKYSSSIGKDLSISLTYKLY